MISRSSSRVHGARVVLFSIRLSQCSIACCFLVIRRVVNDNDTFEHNSIHLRRE